MLDYPRRKKRKHLTVYSGLTWKMKPDKLAMNRSTGIQAVGVGTSLGIYTCIHVLMGLILTRIYHGN